MSVRGMLIAAALAVVLTVGTANADGLNRKLLQATTAPVNPSTTTPTADNTQATPQAGDSGPDSWQFWGNSGRVWQRPGWGGDNYNDDRWSRWGNMQSQSQAQPQAEVQAAAAVPAQTAAAVPTQAVSTVPTQADASNPVNEQAASQQPATAAGVAPAGAQNAGATTP